MMDDQNDMTLQEATDAELWQTINWQKIRRNVMNFQRRIVRAYHENNNEKLTILEWLVTNSFSAKALAVWLVTESKGARTAGIDNERCVTDSQKYRAILQLQPDQYTPNPYLRVYIPKSQGKTRPLSIPTFKDRAMQSLYKFVLEPIAECSADSFSFGYRRWRSTLDAVKECRRLLLGGAEWIIEGDISGCFDNISHDWLLSNIPMEKTILRKILKCGYIEKRSRQKHPCEVGVAQGGQLSPILCNLTLDGLRGVVKRHCGDLELIRYADDFIIAGKNLKVLCDVLPVMTAFLAERGLALSNEKTSITNVRTGFDFLGYHFRKDGQDIVLEPSQKSVNNVLSRLQKEISNQKTCNHAETSNSLNSIIRGWTNYHQYCTERGAFLYIDLMTSRYLAEYGAHPDIQESLIAASETQCQPLASARTEANPFDADWRLYFEEWAYARRFHTRSGYNQLASAFSRQNGVCPICKQEIEGDFAIHVRRRKQGRVLKLMHPECHNSIHNRLNKKE